MILVSGFNVYPNEIEDVMTMHDGIVEAAAIGVPDDKTGEAVKLFVVCRDLSLLTPQGNHTSLPRVSHRLQGAESDRVPFGTAQDQCWQDSAARIARRGHGCDSSSR